MASRRCYGPDWEAEMGAVHRELEALGPRYTGAMGQAECDTFCWYEEGRLPKAENLAKLAAIRADIAGVRREMLEKNKTAGLERIDWLLTTIDWLTRYDAAAMMLCKGSKVDLLLTKAEVKSGDGDKAGARVGRPGRGTVSQLRLRRGLADISLENDHLR